MSADLSVGTVARAPATATPSGRELDDHCRAHKPERVGVEVIWARSTCVVLCSCTDLRGTQRACFPGIPARSVKAVIPTIALHNGTTIPQLGFGTWLVSQDEAEDVVGRALEVGYRHIDTAQGYGNEKGVGAAVAASGIDRGELFLTSKLNNDKHAPADVRASFEQTLEDLRTDYLDLFLIHWPLPTRYDGDFTSTWEAMVELLGDGRLRAAGVSNFEPAHLEKIIADTGVTPAVNQIESHPYFPNRLTSEWSLQRGIAVEAWGPLGQGKVLGDPVIRELAEELGKSDAQVILRWHIQRGAIVFPKSVSTERMRQNLELFDFELTARQISRIDALDQGPAGRVGPHPDVFDMV